MRYHQSGKIPQKRHTVFKSENDHFYYEQLFGTEGFHGISSLLYHIHRPTQIKSISEPKDVTPKIAVGKNVTPRMFKGMNVYNTWISAILADATLGIPFSVLILKNYFA